MMCVITCFEKEMGICQLQRGVIRINAEVSGELETEVERRGYSVLIHNASLKVISLALPL